jgi:2-polyprenyl-3-methyl-5-hydroxy-6-metoxy-1,4-benzoquinol methylase
MYNKIEPKNDMGSIRNDYYENYDKIAAADLTESIQPVEFLELQSDRLFEILRKYISDFGNCKILEIGPGQGHLLKKIIANGGTPELISALDISNDYLKKLQPLGMNTYQMDAEKITFQEEFDLVICTDVIEHVINPANLMFGINKCLKKNGLLLLKAPYRENFLRYSRELGCIWDFVHLRTFSRQCFKDTVRYAAFKVLQYKTTFFDIHSMKYYIKSNKYTHKIYNLLTKNRRKSMEEFNKYPSWVLRLFFKPLEQLVIAKKINHLTQGNLNAFW